MFLNFFCMKFGCFFKGGVEKGVCIGISGYELLLRLN